ncbi:MAG: DUF2442 domain-containing protein [Pseudomonadota bacterium]
MKNEDTIIDAGYLPAIKSARVTSQPYTLALHFDDGARMVADMSDFIGRYQALIPLLDPAVFSDFSLLEQGGGLRWACGAGVAADTLRRLAEAQLDLTGRDVQAWAKRVGLTVKEAAQALGVAPRTMEAYRASQNALPAMVTIACRAMEQDPTLLHARLAKSKRRETHKKSAGRKRA